MPCGLKRQSRPGHLSEEMVVARFRENRLLEQFRDGSDSLFLTYKMGKKESPSSQTISRWLVEVIKIAYNKQNKSLGEVKKSGHSTRGASTSWALFNGASVASILKAADWKENCVFANHYLRAMAEERVEFQTAVLHQHAQL